MAGYEAFLQKLTRGFPMFLDLERVDFVHFCVAQLQLVTIRDWRAVLHRRGFSSKRWMLGSCWEARLRFGGDVSLRMGKSQCHCP